MQLSAKRRTMKKLRRRISPDGGQKLKQPSVQEQRKTPQQQQQREELIKELKNNEVAKEIYYEKLFLEVKIEFEEGSTLVKRITCPTLEKLLCEDKFKKLASEVINQINNKQGDWWSTKTKEKIEEHVVNFSRIELLGKAYEEVLARLSDKSLKQLKDIAAELERIKTKQGEVPKEEAETGYVQQWEIMRPAPA